MMNDAGMDWGSYHKGRRAAFLGQRKVSPIRCFSDADKISLAEAGATCYHPNEDNGWDTREWLESIYCVRHHGCCTGCGAREKCESLSPVKGD